MNIDVKTHNYFPVNYMVLGFGVIAFGLLSILSIPYVSVPVIIIGIMLLTTQYRFVIDIENKSYKDYLWILGYQKGDWESFKTANFFYINSSLSSQSHGTVSVRFHSEIQEYIGFLKLDDETNINLGESEDKSHIISTINELNQYLNIPIKDLTEIK